MRDGFPTLWRNTNFVKLWLGQTISLVGSNITLLAIPLAAVSQLHATPTQMGILQMAQYLPFLLFGLLAGVWVDRLPRRPVLVVADLGRAAALAVIPLAAFNQWLSMELLYGVVFVIGIFNLLFEAAYAAFLPVVVPREQVADGNSRLQTSAAAAEIAGPGLAGWLIQVATAAFALLGDALSFLGSAIVLMLMRVDEARPKTATLQRAIVPDLKAGLSAVLHNDYIRSLTFCSASANLFINMHLAIYVLFLTRQVGLTPAQIGLLYSVASVGGLLGAICAGPIARRIGLGRAFIAESIAVGLAATAIPLLARMGPGAVPLLALVHGVWGFWLPIYIVNAASLRQVLTPNHLLGRVTASSRFISWGAATFGFLIGGIVAEWIGLVPTLVIAGLGVLASSLWVIQSPIRSLHVMPTPHEAGHRPAAYDQALADIPADPASVR